MPEYDNTNTGVLFRNKHKQEGDNKPDYTGKINVDGKDFNLAGWIKTPKNGGAKFMSFKVSEIDEYAQAPPSASEEDAPF